MAGDGFCPGKPSQGPASFHMEVVDLTFQIEIYAQKSLELIVSKDKIYVISSLKNLSVLGPHFPSAVTSSPCVYPYPVPIPRPLSCARPL